MTPHTFHGKLQIMLSLFGYPVCCFLDSVLQACSSATAE